MQLVQSRLHNSPLLLPTMEQTSIFSDGAEKRVRMANLCIIGSHIVNGVSELHSHILESSLFQPFTLLDSEKIINITNGITPRRWLLQCNPGSGRPAARP